MGTSATAVIHGPDDSNLISKVRTSRVQRTTARGVLAPGLSDPKLPTPTYPKSIAQSGAVRLFAKQ